MLLGSPKNGVHIVVWGDCMVDTENINMWFGIPADTLERIGYRNVKADYILPIPLRGCSTIRFDWRTWLLQAQQKIRMSIGRAHGTNWRNWRLHR